MRDNPTGRNGSTVTLWKKKNQKHMKHAACLHNPKRVSKEKEKQTILSMRSGKRHIECLNGLYSDSNQSLPPSHQSNRDISLI